MKYQDGNSGSTLKVKATVPFPAVLADQGRKGPDESSKGAVPAPLGTQLSCEASTPVKLGSLHVTVRRAVVVAVAAIGAEGDAFTFIGVVNATEMLRVCVPLKLAMNTRVPEQLPTEYAVEHGRRSTR